MTEAEIEVILQRGREKYPEAKPRIISDNGPQFIARDFKEFIRIAGMTHVRTSPGYPQSNGKLERWHKSLKSECIRPGTPLTSPPPAEDLDLGGYALDCGGQGMRIYRPMPVPGCGSRRSPVESDCAAALGRAEVVAYDLYGRTDGAVDGSRVGDRWRRLGAAST
jgi:transposase InsO family protein